MLFKIKLLITLLLALSACANGDSAYLNGGNEIPPSDIITDTTAGEYENEAPETTTAAAPNEYESEIPEVSPETQPEVPRERTDEELLGEKIIMAGTFWEDWWNMRGRFDWENAGERKESSDGLISGYLRLLPASGFENLSDIRNYLLQYYTEERLDTEWTDPGAWISQMLSGVHPAFTEYDGLLYIHAIRAGFPRPNWETAVNTFLGKDNLLGDDIERAVFETTVLWGSWHRVYSGGYAYP